MVGFMSISSTAEAASSAGHRQAMDRMYRLQRHIYDATRAYYLLGRDQMIAGLEPPEGGTVLEIGCGTGRNLLQAAARFPGRTFYGLDISHEMLKSACAAVGRHGLNGRIRLAQADATDFDAVRSFGTGSFDRVYFSYTLSMIPEWQRAMSRAAELLHPGGELHVVDFGTCEQLPKAAKLALHRWLAAFHVTPRKDLAMVADAIARTGNMTQDHWQTHRGYAAHFRMLKRG